MSQQLAVSKESQSREFKRGQRAIYVLEDGFLDSEKTKALHELIPADSPAETMADVEAGVNRGEFELMDIYEDAEKIGFTIFAVIEGDSGQELLSIATYAKGRGNIAIEGMPLLEGVAKSRGCKTIRLHTMRTGLVKKLTTGLNWYVSEIVMRKEIL